MHTSSPTRPAEHIGHTAADRAGRDAASSLAAIADTSPHTTPLDTILVCVLDAHVSDATADDETAAIVRALLAERQRRHAATVAELGAQLRSIR